MCQQGIAPEASTFAANHFNSAQYSPIRGGDCAKTHIKSGLVPLFLANDTENRRHIHNEEVGGAGALISIIGMYLTAYFLLSAEYKPASAERRLPPEAKLSGAKTTAQLPQERLADVTPSITERTTDLLECVAGQPVERKSSAEKSPL